MNHFPKDYWQHKLRLYLGSLAGKELRVGDLFALFGSDIPLEIASRRWVKRGGPNGQELDSNEIMRFAVFSKYVHSLPLVRPLYRRDEKFNKDTIIVTGEARICAGCKRPFVSETKYCGFVCGTRFGAHLAAKTRPPKPEPEKKYKKYKRQRVYINLSDENLRIFEALNNKDGKKTSEVLGELVLRDIETRLAIEEINEEDKALLVGVGG